MILLFATALMKLSLSYGKQKKCFFLVGCYSLIVGRSGGGRKNELVRISFQRQKNYWNMAINIFHPFTLPFL